MCRRAEKWDIRIFDFRLRKNKDALAVKQNGGNHSCCGSICILRGAPRKLFEDLPHTGTHRLLYFFRGVCVVAPLRGEVGPLGPGNEQQWTSDSHENIK